MPGLFASSQHWKSAIQSIMWVSHNIFCGASFAYKYKAHGSAQL